MKTEDRWLTDFFENSLDTPEQKEIAQRLINRAVEMQPVYDELDKKLPSSSQKQCVMQAIIDIAILYGENIRDKIRFFKEKEKEIAKTAYKLAELIENYKSNESRFKPCIPNLFELINDAGSNNTCYELHIRDKIDEIRIDDYRFLHAPDIEDILRTLAVSLYEEPEPIGRLLNYSEDQVVLQSQKFSHFDFIRALWRRIEFFKKVHYGSLLPRNFRLSHGAIRTIVNCALDLNSNITEDNIKKGKKFVTTEDDVKKAIKSIKPAYIKGEDFDIKKV